MRVFFLAALALAGAVLICPAVSTDVVAKPSVSADVFHGDRYSMRIAQGASAQDVMRSMRCPAPLYDCQSVRRVKKKWKKPRHERVKAAVRPVAVIVPLPRARPELDDEQAAAYRAIAALLEGGKIYVRPLPEPMPAIPSVRQTLIGGLAREIGAAFGTPQRFVRGRLICARNVNSALAERGIKGTGSALAKSFLAWGRKSPPVPGAVAIFNRGRNPKAGHVAIVHKVLPNGTMIYVNPSASKQRWVIGPYRGRPIAFRVASI